MGVDNHCDIGDNCFGPLCDSLSTCSSSNLWVRRSFLMVTIIIPTLNERDGIDSTVNRIPCRELEQSGYGVEVIVVDGGSEDGTTEIATKCGCLVVVEPRRGYGRAYKTGFLKSTGDVLITTDGDGTYPVENIPEMVRLVVMENFDFVTTNRFHKMEVQAMHPLARLGNAILSYSLRFLFSVSVSDSQSGMWALRRTFANELHVNADGMAFSQELKVRAFKSGRATEIPIFYRRRLGRRKLKFLRDGLANLLHLIRLRFIL